MRCSSPRRVVAFAVSLVVLSIDGSWWWYNLVERSIYRFRFGLLPSTHPTFRWRPIRRKRTARPGRLQLKILLVIFRLNWTIASIRCRRPFSFSSSFSLLFKSPSLTRLTHHSLSGRTRAITNGLWRWKSSKPNSHADGWCTMSTADIRNSFGCIRMGSVYTSVVVAAVAALTLVVNEEIYHCISRLPLWEGWLPGI